MIKECSKCHKQLLMNSENFHRHKASKDGYYPQCKICKNDYRRTPKGKLSTKVKDKNKIKNHPDKFYAMQAVHYAVKTGKLDNIKNCKCVNCHTQAQEYHHWSYEKIHRLDVIPLCKRCHVDIHNGLIVYPLSRESAA